MRISKFIHELFSPYATLSTRVSSSRNSTRGHISSAKKTVSLLWAIVDDSPSVVITYTRIFQPCFYLRYAWRSETRQNNVCTENKHPRLMTGVCLRESGRARLHPLRSDGVKCKKAYEKSRV